jgi:hypothetical protein
LRHLARIAAAELDSARGRSDSARNLLEQARDSSREEGLLLLALEAQAELARLAIELGEPDAGALADDVRLEAERLGAGRIALRLPAPSA